MIVNEITDIQKAQLLRVIPSKDRTIEYRPCKVTLKNGDTLDNVFVQEVKSYLKTWGAIPETDPGKGFVLIEEVTERKESPNRLLPDLANKIYKAGESGMGYFLFKLVFDNGQTLNVSTGNAVDFIPLPPGLTSQNVTDALPHQASRDIFITGPEYLWCLYKGVVPTTYHDKKVWSKIILVIAFIISIIFLTSGIKDFQYLNSLSPSAGLGGLIPLFMGMFKIGISIILILFLVITIIKLFYKTD